MPIQVTYQDSVYDTAINYKIIEFYYERPVFPETNQALANINATYDGLENTWQAEIPAFTTEGIKRWNGSSTTWKNAYIKYDERNQMKVTCKEVYNKNNLLSVQQNYFRGLVGTPHGYNELTAHTFNTRTGGELRLGDLLSINETQIKSKLTNEFAKLNNSDVDLDNVYEQLGADAKY